MMLNAISRPYLLALALTAVMAGDRASAEGNRLLPFWAQPYPYGYAYRSTEREGAEPCAQLRRDRHGRVPRERCVVVLHARD